MRVTYLHQYFNTPEMAGGSRSFELGRRLVEMGHEVNMITSWRDESGPEGQTGWFETEEAGMRVHWIPVPYSNSMGFNARVRSFIRFAVAASIRARQLDADVVYATSTPLTIAIPGIASCMGRRIPLVFEVRDLWPDIPISMGALSNPISIACARVLELAAYRYARQIVALSPGMAEGVIARGVAPERVSVIPNSSDLDLFRPDLEARSRFRRRQGWEEDQPLIVYTGTLGRINGVGFLVRVAAVMKDLDPEVRFLVVGDGAEWEMIREMAEELGVLGTHFHMWRRLSKRDLVEVLAAADMATSIFIDNKDMWHNSANKFFDALSSGTPIGINYGGWQAAILEENGAGIAFHPTDPVLAAQAIVECLRTPGRLPSMGARARELAETRFSRDDHARQLEQVLVDGVRDASCPREADCLRADGPDTQEG